MIRSLALASMLVTVASAQDATPVDSAFQDSAFQDAAFPASTALAEGVSPDAVAGLDAIVRGLVDDDEIVGAELLVLKNGRTILHEAYGWRDRDAEVPMATGSVFCVRSMTKPVVGAAILMLIDEDRLELDDRVSKFLPSFDVDGKREITVEHLLTHTSGLPMSLLMGKDLRSLDGIRAVADLGGDATLEFEPGTAFNYSDQGTDTLTALIEIVSGDSVEDFVRTRVLEPLGMRESACVLTSDFAQRDRLCSKYAGTPGQWTRFWSPDEPVLFPFFLGSQSLYSTVTDYARFMEFWRRKGRVGEGRLLSARYVRKALEPGPYPLEGAPTGLPGLRCDYGFLMQLWTGPHARRADEREVVAYGHTGSDGTHAWVFPEHDAMVLYFTQSRGTGSGLRVEEALGELFLGVPFDANQAAPPLEQYLGYYQEDEDDLYRAIIRDGDDLALEVVGKAIVPLTYIGDDRWKLRPSPSTVLTFDRSETGEVTGYHSGDHQEFRFEPAADLPSAGDVAESVAKAHRLDLLESLGPLRMTGSIEIPKLGLSGRYDSVYAWPGSFRIDNVMGESKEHVTFDGERVRYSSSTQPVTTLEGSRADSVRLDSPFAHFGDWGRWYSKLEVVQRMRDGDRTYFLVRAGDTSSPATTLFVDSETGRVVHLDGFMYTDTMGRIGHRVNFGDFRDVQGMTMPFMSETTVANPMIGKVVTKVVEFEVGVDVPAGTFEL